MENLASNSKRSQSPEETNNSTATSLGTNPQSLPTQSTANNSCNEEVETSISTDTNKEGPRVPSTQDHSNMVSPNSELITGLDNLLGALTEPQITTYRFARAPQPEPPLRFSPYPVHQQLFLRQQREQERRRHSLSAPAASSRYNSPSTPRHDFRCRNVRLGFADDCRVQTIQKVLAFVDKRTLKKISTEKDCSEKCVICMSNYAVNEELRELKCSHKFHKKCIDEWLIKSFLCPVCRTDVARSERTSCSSEGSGSSRSALFGSTSRTNFDEFSNIRIDVAESNRSGGSQLQTQTKD